MMLFAKHHFFQKHHFLFSGLIFSDIHWDSPHNTLKISPKGQLIRIAVHHAYLCQGISVFPQKMRRFFDSLRLYIL